jgi:23S rRNA pseudouridine2605 synthase
MSGAERLQKILAAAGIASRRASEQLIQDGRVSVNGKVVTELGTKVDPDLARIEVDGRLVRSQRPRYIMLNKPSGYITTVSDERGRRTVAELVSTRERVVPVGRLDRPTQGLLLFTNDGPLANRVMHPKYELDKEYLVLTDGFPPPEIINALREGISIDGVRTVPDEVRPLKETQDGLLIKVVIQEGRNRIVRRMFDALNYPVVRLVRTRIGPIQLGNLPRGTWRDLSEGELNSLKEAVGMGSESELQASSRPGPNRSHDRRRR